MHRFIPVYANRFGAKIIEVPVQHHPRRFGKTSYGLERTVKVLLDLFTVKFLISYSSKPIYLFGGAGIGHDGYKRSGITLPFHSQGMVLDLSYPVAFFPDQRDHRLDGISIRNDGFDRRITCPNVSRVPGETHL